MKSDKKCTNCGGLGHMLAPRFMDTQIGIRCKDQRGNNKFYANATVSRPSDKVKEDVADLTTSKKPTGFKWIYKVKLKPYGSIYRYNARVCS